MSTGLPQNFTSYIDFDDTECNIDIDSMTFNNARGQHDHYYDGIIERLKQIPVDNPGYWTREQVLGPAPPVPPTFHTLKGKFKKSKTGKSKGKSKKQEQGKVNLATGSDKPAPSSSHGQSVTSIQPTGHPARGNLVNTDNLCYSSAVLQVYASIPGLKALIDDFPELPFKTDTGRGDMAFLRDPGFAKHKRFLSSLWKVVGLIHETSNRVPIGMTSELMGELRKIDNQFIPGAMLDAADLFTCIFTMLSYAGDNTEPKASIHTELTTAHLIDGQNARLVEGHPLLPLEDDVPAYLKAHRRGGNDSLADRTLTITVALESECVFINCGSLVGRTFEFLLQLNLEFPAGSGNASVKELIRRWVQSEGEARCGHKPEHGNKRPAIKKIVGTPEVLVIRVKRFDLTANPDYMYAQGDILEDLGRLVTNEITLEPILDIREFCETKLPSERTLGELRTSRLLTRYKLTGVVRLIPLIKHYVTYAFAPDQDNVLHWAKFNDMNERVEWGSPFDASNVQELDSELFYTRLSEEEAKQMEAEGMEVEEVEGAEKAAVEKKISVVEVSSDGGEEEDDSSSEGEGSVIEISSADEE